MIKSSRKFVRWLTKKIPKRLYACSLIIIIAPMVFLQTVIDYIFMERHWQMVTNRLSTAIVHDISAISMIFQPLLILLKHIRNKITMKISSVLHSNVWD